MKSENIYCGNCGTENPTKNNYCFDCGQKLDKPKAVKTKVINPIDSNLVVKKESISNSPQKAYLDIRSALIKLINNNAFIIISQGDYYVQFGSSQNSVDIYFEAVSREFNPIIGDKNLEFKNLSFVLEKNCNYYKYITTSDLSSEDLIREIEFIFNNIYGIPLNNYEVHFEADNINDPNYYDPEVIDSLAKINKKSLKTEKTSNNQIGFIILGFIVLLISIWIYLDSNTSSNNTSSENSSSDTNSFNNSSYNNYTSTSHEIFQIPDPSTDIMVNTKVTIRILLKSNYLEDESSYKSISWTYWYQYQNIQANNAKYWIKHKFRAMNNNGHSILYTIGADLDRNGNCISIVFM